MAPQKFKAMVVTETDEHTFVRHITERSLDDLPDGDVLIKVRYSSLNYKDALSASGNRGVTKRYPHTPGVDAAGIVEESAVAGIRPGEEVIVTGYDLGMNTSGGFGEYVRVPADWIVKRPGTLSLRESMIYGTAGFTAALSVFRMMAHGVSKDCGDVLVTGATGGVGSIAVSILAKEGYNVVAVTGKQDQAQFLRDLGAAHVITRQDAVDTAGRPLLKERWAGVIDTVGGDILATAVKSTQYGGTVTCCGNVASPDLPLNVFPFILRGVSLIGIDSVNCPSQPRLLIWEKLAGEWKLEHLDSLTREIDLGELNSTIENMLRGRVKGRAIVRVSP
jgi:acrylyl-CoA reductase (NADPH)